MKIEYVGGQKINSSAPQYHGSQTPGVHFLNFIPLDINGILFVIDSVHLSIQ